MRRRFSIHPASQPAFLSFRSSKPFIIFTISLALFTDIFLYGLVVPILPFALATRAGVAEEDVQAWISILLAVYGAALLVASPVVGFYADKISSRRVPLLAGLVALGGATAMLCIGSSIQVLVVARVLQGISAAVVWVVGLALLVDTVGGDGIGAAMGYAGLAMSLAILLAPLLGGLVFADSGYYQVFYMAFGLLGLDIVLRLVMVEKKIAKRWIADDASSNGSREEDEEVKTEEKEASEGVDEASSSTEEKTAGHSVEEDVSEPNITKFQKFVRRLPPVLFLLTSRRLLSALWASVVQSALLTAFDSILPLYVRDTFHWNSIGAGLIFLPMILTTFLGPAVGWGSDKYGPRWFSTLGFICACPCLILLRLVDHDSMNQKVLLCALLALLGLCLTFAITPIMAEITYAVDSKSKRHAPGFFGKNGAYAQAYSLFNVAWAAGAMIGPLMAGLITKVSGWGMATLILGILSAVTTIPVVIWTGGSIFKLKKERRKMQSEG